MHGLLAAKAPTPVEVGCRRRSRSGSYNGRFSFGLRRGIRSSAFSTRGRVIRTNLIALFQTAIMVLSFPAAGTLHAQAVDLGTCALPLDRPLRSIHVGGNWGTNWWVVKWWEEKEPPRGALIPPDYIEYVKNLDVNWVGISVALHIEDSTDSTVERAYSQDVASATFSDEALRRMIRDFTEQRLQRLPDSGI